MRDAYTRQVSSWRETFLNAALGPEPLSCIGQMLTTHQVAYQKALDRQQKRLQSLQTVRPAFMDEFERLEEELSAHYHYYLQNHRNLAYLESELEKIEFKLQGIDQLIGFFDSGVVNRNQRLLEIPRAAGIWLAQARHQII